VKAHFQLLLTLMIGVLVLGCDGNTPADSDSDSHDPVDQSQKSPGQTKLVYHDRYQDEHNKCLLLLKEHAPHMLRLSEAVPSFRFGVEYRTKPEDFAVLDESVGEKFDEVVDMLKKIRQAAPAVPVMIHMGTSNGFYLSNGPKGRTGIITLGRESGGNRPYKVTLGEGIIRKLTLAIKTVDIDLPATLHCHTVVDLITGASYDELISTGLVKTKAAMEKTHRGRKLKVQISPIKGQLSKESLGPDAGPATLYVALDSVGGIEWSTLDEFLDLE
jgi:hypothetical protein